MFFSGDTKICDATYLKREGKKVYAANQPKNYNIGCYELLQDVLFTVERYKDVNFIYDFRIINHNKRHRTKPQEIIEAIKKGDWIINDGGLKARKAGVKLITRLRNKSAWFSFCQVSPCPYFHSCILRGQA